MLMRMHAASLFIAAVVIGALPMTTHATTVVTHWGHSGVTTVRTGPYLGFTRCCYRPVVAGVPVGLVVGVAAVPVVASRPAVVYAQPAVVTYVPAIAYAPPVRYYYVP